MSSFKGIINASFIVFTLIIMLSLFFGRAYCAWFCPGCGIQEMLTWVVKKKSANNKAVYLKYVIFGLWLLSIITGYFLHGFVKVDITYGMSDITPERKIILTLGALLITVPLTLIFGKFASCKYICWQAPFMILGTKVRDLFNLKGLRLRVNPEKCISCNKCITKCPMNINVMEQVKIGRMNHSECILCGSCIESCKTGAIKYSSC
jgi:polyferredoxin